MRTIETPDDGVLTAGLIARARNILLQPRSEWLQVAAETGSAAGLYKGYVAILAAIPALCGWLGIVLVGVDLPFAGHVRVPAGAALVSALTRYLLTLVGVYVLALIIEWLAPTFAGNRDRMQALKLSVYAATPGWLAGVLALVPMLGILRLLAGLYAIYLLYLGVPPLMKVPQDRALGYTAVVLVAAVVIFFAIGLVAGAFVSYPLASFSGLHG